MKVKSLIDKLNLNCFNEEGLEREITGGYVSDLLSDVMGNANEGQCWITLQTHKNISAIASLRDLSCIIISKGLKPDLDTIDACNSEDIAILGSGDQTFELAGKLYSILKNEN
ncbi:MAG: serine kinase [Candidatus Delongbacteria bacterium]|nr:serine kinase [Candidatus Delongbacteria bacterium]MBN2834947.1 serine kinase [Candidatus Delongbacteria bacterium]